MDCVRRIHIQANENHWNEDREKLHRALAAYEAYHGYPFVFKFRKPHMMSNHTLANFAWFLGFEIQMKKAEVEVNRRKITVVA